MSARHDNAGIASSNGTRIIKDAPITSFKEAYELYERVRWAIHKDRMSSKRIREGKKVDLRVSHAADGNVYLRKHSPPQHGLTLYMAVVLYDTEIVRFYPDGTFSVDNGGFNTPTSSARITQFTPAGFSAYHHRKQLCLTGGGEDRRGLDHDTRIKP